MKRDAHPHAHATLTHANGLTRHPQLERDAKASSSDQRFAISVPKKTAPSERMIVAPLGTSRW